MRDRFKYICSILPGIFLLNNLPLLLGDVWQLVAASLLALAVWVLVWLRLFQTRRLRPEFAVLVIAPQLISYIALYAGAEAIAPFSGNAWLNCYALLWIGSAFVAIRSFRPGAWETVRGKHRDSVFIMMAILTVFYSFYSCGAFYKYLFLNNL